MIDLAELEAKARAATQGAWDVFENLGQDEAWCDWHRVGPFDMTGGKASADDLFIQASRPSIVLELIERVRAAEAKTAEPVAWETCPNCNGSGLQLNSAGEPDDCRECKGDTVVCAAPPNVSALQERVRVLEEALRPFVIGSAEREHLLWGHLPDDAPGTTTTKLGDYRRARKALGGSNE